MVTEKKVITDLYKHELTVQKVYHDIMAKIDNPEIRENLTCFLRDHEKHIENLSNKIVILTGSKPSKIKNVKGTIIAGYVALRSMAGQHGALTALQTVEEDIVKHYRTASTENISKESLELINTHLKEEEKYNQYIKSLI